MGHLRLLFLCNSSAFRALGALKTIQIVAILLFVIQGSTIFSAAHWHMKEQQEVCGITFAEDQYKNVHIVVPESGIKDFAVFVENFKKFVAKHKSERPGSALMLFMSDEPGSRHAMLKKLGFKSWDSNSVGAQWVMLNGSAMNEPFSAQQGARVILLKYVNDQPFVAIIQDRLKPLLTFPGGGVDKGEFPVEGAVRECWEEVGIVVKPEQLGRIATIHQKNGNRYGANNVCDFYLAEVDAELELVPEEKEVENAYWVSLKQLVQDGQFKGLYFSKASKRILEHVFNKGKSERIILPDYRHANQNLMLELTEI